MTKKIYETNILLKNIINAIQDIKGQNIISLNFKNIESAICKYFVICTGTSNTHVAAITNSIKKNVSKTLKEKPYSMEGIENQEWVLMDYVDVVVHIFLKNVREFYDIENLWGDAKISEIKIKA